LTLLGSHKTIGVVVDSHADNPPEREVDDLAPGTMVGKFRVEAKIGEGGFGTVYRAVNDIDKVGAIKVLRLRYSADPEMVSRFKAEARAVNQIRHKNIIDIFEFGALPDGRQYYVMEYLGGMPLDEYLEQVHHLELAAALPILRGIARALDAAHGKGIAHRDLKPENVFLVNDEDRGLEPKLLDFGIAKLLHNQGEQSHKTRTGAPIGTPYYMSPEQARGRGHRPWSKEIDVTRGETIELHANLRRSFQRKLAYVVLGASAGSLAVSALTGLAAAGANSDANELEDTRRNTRPLTPTELDERDRLIDERDTALTATYILLGVGAGFAATGAVLYFMDTPGTNSAELPAARRSSVSAPSIAVSTLLVGNIAGITVSGSF
jgi:serine/threonine protein kinase